MAAEEEEYELMPLTPLRRLEKEVQSIKEMRGPTLDREVIHELIESNITTQRKLNKTLESLDLLNTNFNEFLSLFKYASKEEIEDTKKNKVTIKEEPITGKIKQPEHTSELRGFDLLTAQNEKLLQSINNLSRHVQKQVFETKYKPTLSEKLEPGKPIRYSRTMSKQL